jgi:hypothetical protein
MSTASATTDSSSARANGPALAPGVPRMRSRPTRAASKPSVARGGCRQALHHRRLDLGSRDDEEPDAVALVDPGGDRNLVGRRPVQDEVALAAQAVAVAVASGTERGVDAETARHRARDGERTGQASRCDAAEEALVLRSVTRLPDQGRELRRGREEGTRGERASVLFHDEGELGEAEAKAAVLLGDRQSRPAELDGALPRLLGEDSGLHRAAAQRGGAALREH